MPLVKVAECPVFDTEEIHKGDLLYGRHRSWPEGQGGIVTSVRADRLTVQYHPKIGNVMNHYYIPASEVSDGDWEIRWSGDLTEIKNVEMTPEESGEPDEGP